MDYSSQKCFWKPDGTGPALLTCLIGGIPLNRVHELEYLPGEVRLGVDYNSAHEYLLKEPSEDYAKAIARGRNELQSLRENPDEVRNVRDKEYAEQLRRDEEMKARKAKEEEMKQLELEQAKQKQADEKRRAQLERQKQAEEQKRSKLMKASYGNTMEQVESKEINTIQNAQDETIAIDSNMVAIGGLVALSAIGSGSLFRGDSSEDGEALESTDSIAMLQNVSVSKDMTSLGNSTASRGIPDSFAAASVNFDDMIGNKQNHTKDNLVNAAPESKQLEKSSHDALMIPNEPTASLLLEEPVASQTLERPKQAWDPDEDDGGLAWLGSLSEMMNEDDDELNDE